jgi:hypothetical protein
VLSFAECNSKLYATIGWTLYRRDDGPTPRWSEVYGLPDPPAAIDPDHYGLRGATAVPNPDGPGQSLRVAVEGRPFSILRIDPRAGHVARTELDVSAFLTRRWGTYVGYGIAAYNDMTRYVDPARPDCPSTLIGFESTTRYSDIAVGQTGKHPYAHFLVRDCHGFYGVRKVVDPTNPYADLVAVRTIAPSPFATDPPGTIYAGGFDAGNMQAHNTAWLYRGRP